MPTRCSTSRPSATRRRSTRRASQYSGVASDDSDVDIEEYEEAGALFDDPEKTTLLSGAMDDPDGADE